MEHPSHRVDDQLEALERLSSGSDWPGGAVWICGNLPQGVPYPTLVEPCVHLPSASFGQINAGGWRDMNEELRREGMRLTLRISDGWATWALADACWEVDRESPWGLAGERSAVLLRDALAQRRANRWQARLLSAAADGDEERFADALAHGADIDGVDSHSRRTALSRAANALDFEGARRAIEAGADPNAHRGAPGCAMAAAIARRGGERMVEALIGWGAGVETGGLCAKAVESRSEPALRVLARAGAPLAVGPGVFCPELSWAAELDSMDCLRALLDMGADPEAPGEDGGLAVGRAKPGSPAQELLLGVAEARREARELAAAMAPSAGSRARKIRGL